MASRRKITQFADHRNPHVRRGFLLRQAITECVGQTRTASPFLIFRSPNSAFEISSALISSAPTSILAAIIWACLRSGTATKHSRAIGSLRPRLNSATNFHPPLSLYGIHTCPIPAVRTHYPNLTRPLRPKANMGYFKRWILLVSSWNEHFLHADPHRRQ